MRLKLVFGGKPVTHSGRGKKATPGTEGVKSFLITVASPRPASSDWPYAGTSRPDPRPVVWAVMQLRHKVRTAREHPKTGCPGSHRACGHLRMGGWNREAAAAGEPDGLGRQTEASRERVCWFAMRPWAFALKAGQTCRKRARRKQWRRQRYYKADWDNG